MSRLSDLNGQLVSFVDPDYKRFGDSLQPGITNRLGVRMPELRRLAKTILNDDPIGFLSEALSSPGLLTSQESVMITAIVLGAAKMRAADRFTFLSALIPYLDGWATVDLTGGELKTFREESIQSNAYLGALLTDERPMAVRLGLVILLCQRKAVGDIDVSLGLLTGASAYELARTEYLVSTGLAWLFATYFAVDPEKIEARVEADVRRGRIDPVTLARTLQKIRDSRRVSKADKLRITARFSERLSRSPSKTG